MTNIVRDPLRDNTYFVFVVEQRLILAEVLLQSTDSAAVDLTVLAHVVPNLIEFLFVFYVAPGKYSEEVVDALDQFPVECLAVSVNGGGEVHDDVEHHLVDAHLLYHLLDLLIRPVILGVWLMQFVGLTKHLVDPLLFYFFVGCLHVLDQLKDGSNDALLLVVPHRHIQFVLIGHVYRFESLRVEHSEYVPSSTEFMVCLHSPLVWSHHKSVLEANVECSLDLYQLFVSVHAQYKQLVVLSSLGAHNLKDCASEADDELLVEEVDVSVHFLKRGECRLVTVESVVQFSNVFLTILIPGLV